MNILFKSILGEFVLDPNYRITKKDKKHVREPVEKDYPKILDPFRSKEYLQNLREANILLTKELIRKSLSEDIFIIQAVNSIEELNKTINTHTKRLREWASYPFPELGEEIEDNERYVHEFLRYLGPKKTDRMSSIISKAHLDEMKALASEIKSLIALRDRQTEYINGTMEKLCPNMTALSGALIGAKLLSQCGGFERLAKTSASKIQLLGAEAALFRHIKTGARAPKHGLIHEHPLIARAKKSEKGKVARRLADKISMAVKIDYFKGKFIGDRLRRELEDDS